MASRKKKIIASIGALFGALGIAAGVLYVLYGRDHYDPSKYESKISDGLAVGSTISFTLPDQFDVSHTIDETVELLIVGWGRKSSRALTEFLDKQPVDYLKRRNAMVVTDISGAPTFIRNRAILPRLKKSPYPIVLIYESAIAERLTDPNAPEGIAVVELKANVVAKASLVADGEALAEALSTASP